MNLGDFTKNTDLNYTLKDKNNGVYVFMIEGEAAIDSQKLKKRDAMGIWETENINLKAQEGSKILLIEVPMNF